MRINLLHFQLPAKGVMCRIIRHLCLGDALQPHFIILEIKNIPFFKVSFLINKA